MIELTFTQAVLIGLAMLAAGGSIGAVVVALCVAARDELISVKDYGFDEGIDYTPYQTVLPTTGTTDKGGQTVQYFINKFTEVA